MKDKCNQCGKLKEISKLISGTCWKCREDKLDNLDYDKAEVKSDYIERSYGI